MVKDILICRVPCFTTYEDMERVEARLVLKIQESCSPVIIINTKKDDEKSILI